MKKKVSILLVVCAFLLSFVIAACGGGAEPFAIEGTNTEIQLDLNGNPSQEITVADFIDENGAKDVSYWVKRASGAGISSPAPSAAAVTDGKFTITASAVTASPAKVELTAYQGDVAKVTVTFSVTVVDSTPRLSVSGIADGAGYTMTGEKTVDVGNDYTFTIVRQYNYSGTPSFTYTVNNAAGAPLTPSVAGNIFTYTIPKAVLNAEGEIVIGDITGFTPDSVTPGAAPVLSDAFFKAATWGGSSGTVTQAGNGVKFENTQNSTRCTPGGIPSELTAGSTANWATGTNEIGPFQYTFMLKAEGNFAISFLSSAAGGSPNELRLIYVNSQLVIQRNVGGAQTNFGYASDAETGFGINKDIRVDMVVSAQNKGITASGLTDAGDTALSGVLKFQLYLDGEKVIFKNTSGATTASATDSSHASRLEEGDVYIQRLATPSGARYAGAFSFNTSPASVHSTQATAISNIPVRGSAAAGAYADGSPVIVSPADPLGERINITGIANGTGYTMSGPATARAGRDYILTITRNTQYINTPAVACTIGGVAYTMPAPVIADNVYTFKIPAVDVTGDIAFGAVTNLLKAIFDVAGIGEKTGYTVNGNATAPASTAYAFTVTIGKGYEATVAYDVSYSVDNVDKGALSGTLTDGTYSYSIPAIEITGDIVISVTGVSLKQAEYCVTGIEGGTGYAMRGSPDDEKTHWDYAYVVTVTLDSGYGVEGVIQLEITIDGEARILTGEQDSVNPLIYTFTVPQEDVIGDIVIVALTGFATEHSVSGMGSGIGYNISGADTAYGNKDYVFTVFSNNPVTVPSVTYTIGGGGAQTPVFEGSSADGRIYSFSIPKTALVLGQSVALSFGSFASNVVTVEPVLPDTVISNADNAATFGFEDFFTNVTGSGVITYFAEYVDGAACDISNNGTSFTVTRMASTRLGDITIRIWALEDGAPVYYKDFIFTTVFEVGTGENFAAGSDDTTMDSVNLLSAGNNYFNPNAWEKVSNESNAAAPELQEDGSLKFTDMAKKAANITSPRITGGLLSEDQPDESFVYSFMFRSDDDQFILTFLTHAGNITKRVPINADGIGEGTGQSTAYELAYSLDGGNHRFAYYMTLGDNPLLSRTMAFYAKDTAYESGKWNRFDMVFTTVYDAGLMMRNGTTPLNPGIGAIKTEMYINGVKALFKTAAGADDAAATQGNVSSSATDNRGSKLVNNDPYFQRLSSAGAQNYSTTASIQTKPGGSIYIAPVGSAVAETAAPFDSEIDLFALPDSFTNTPEVFKGSYTGSADGSDISENITLQYRLGNLRNRVEAVEPSGEEAGSDAVPGELYTRAFSIAQLDGTPTANIQLVKYDEGGYYWDVLNDLESILEQSQEASAEMLKFAANANAYGYSGFWGSIRGNEKTEVSATEGGFAFLTDEYGTYLVTCTILRITEEGFTRVGSYTVKVNVLDAALLDDVTVTDSSSGIGYSLSGSMTAYEGYNYNFSLSVASNYTVTEKITVAYTVNGGAEQTLEAVKNTSGIYNFMVPGTTIDGDIVIVSVTGISELFTVDISAVETSIEYTLTAVDATVVEGFDYSFIVELTEGYIAPAGLSVDYTMGGASASVNGVYESGVYTFTIEDADGDIVLTAVNGIVSQNTFTVSGAPDVAGSYTVAYETTAYQGVAHVVTITVTDPADIPTLTYTVDTTTQNAEFVSSSADGTVYEFKIPAADITGDITLAAGLAGVSGISVKGDAPTSPEIPFDTRTATFDFADFIDADGVPGTVTYIAELISGGEATLNSEGVTFTINGMSDSYVVRIWVLIDGVPAFRHDVTIKLAVGADTADKLNFTGGVAVDSTDEIDAWKFTSQGANSSFFEAGITNTAAAPETVTWGTKYHYSFMLKANGTFDWRFTSNGGTNYLFFEYDGSKFTFARTVTNTTRYGSAYDADTGYKKGEWNRFDLIISAEKVKWDANDVIADDVAVNGFIRAEFYINGEKVIFKNNSGNATFRDNAISGHEHICINGTVYQQRANGSTRYGQNFTIVPQAGNPVWIKPC